MAKGFSKLDLKGARNALDKLDDKRTAEGDVIASAFALRRLMDKHDVGIADIVALFQPTGDVDLRAGLEAVTRERDKLARRVTALEEAAAARLDAANETRRERARRFAREIWHEHVAAIRRAHSGISSTGIAAELNRRKVLTPWGGTEGWTRMQVHRLARHLGYNL